MKQPSFTPGRLNALPKAFLQLARHGGIFLATGLLARGSVRKLAAGAVDGGRLSPPSYAFATRPRRLLQSTRISFCELKLEKPLPRGSRAQRERTPGQQHCCCYTGVRPSDPGKGESSQWSRKPKTGWAALCPLTTDRFCKYFCTPTVCSLLGSVVGNESTVVSASGTFGQ